MTKIEAVKAMLAGATITHRYFSGNEWVRMPDQNTIETEDGVRCQPVEFWRDRSGLAFNDGWGIYKFKQHEQTAERSDLRTAN